MPRAARYTELISRFATVLSKDDATLTHVKGLCIFPYVYVIARRFVASLKLLMMFFNLFHSHLTHRTTLHKKFMQLLRWLEDQCGFIV